MLIKKDFIRISLKKGYMEHVCFAKHNDEKLNKLAEKYTSAMVDCLSDYNKESIEVIMNKLESLFLKVKG